MSRSYRHSPFLSYSCAESDKPGKIFANRSLRAASRATLAGCNDFDDLLMPVIREVSNVYTFPKDGKTRISASHAKYRKWMRK